MKINASSLKEYLKKNNDIKNIDDKVMKMKLKKKNNLKNQIKVRFINILLFNLNINKIFVLKKSIWKDKYIYVIIFFGFLFFVLFTTLEFKSYL